MIDVKYYKDFRHNYLIIKNEDTPTDVYQCKMITENKIEGLLSCKERHINGEMLLYYEITSKQSFASLYEGRPISMQQLKKLFMQLKLAGGGMSRYLLDESCLMLKPEYIYADIETGELSFLYYPYETDENYMLSLLEFLADKVDGEEEAAVEVAYKALELAAKEQFVLDEVLQWFEQDYGENHQDPQDSGGYEAPFQESCQDGTMPEAFLDDEGEIAAQVKETGTGKIINMKTACFGMILAAALAGLLYYACVSFQLSEKELIYLYAGFFLSGFLFLASGFCVLYCRFFKRNKELPEKSSGIWNREKEDRKKPYREIVMNEKLQEQKPQAYGNTVFIPWTENCENKLYGTGKGNKNHIDLNKLPLTVGKLAGSVDMVINEQSISRRHVKFAREGSRICMTDLNSTNGTFKNGLRLQPNTSEILEPGDEIRLGKLKFIYR